jgi:hypothetical protein
VSGWIKLHRSMLDWEWYDDMNTFRLFTHLILTVNHTEKKWRGMSIPRGSRWTSLDVLAQETGLSIRMIRTSLNRLESTGEVTSKSQATGKVRGRMISISKYNDYQVDDKQTTSRATDKRQASDKQTTGTKECKNDKNNNISDLPSEKSLSESQKVDQFFLENQVTKEQVSEIRKIRKANKAGSVTERVAKALLKEFKAGGQMGWSLDDMLDEWASRGWKGFKAEWLSNQDQKQARIQQSSKVWDPQYHIDQLEGL